MAPSAAIANAIASRWSFFASTSPPRSRLRPRTWKPSGCSSISPPIRRKPVRERRDAIALLDAQLLRAAHTQLAAVRGQRGEHRQLVDDAGHFVRHDLGATADPHDGRAIVPIGSPACACAITVLISAPIRSRMSMMPVRDGLSPTCSMVTSEPGKRRRGDHPERGRRDVAGHVERAADQPLAAAHRDRRSGAPDLRAERLERPLRVVACRHRLDDPRHPVSMQSGEEHGSS